MADKKIKILAVDDEVDILNLLEFNIKKGGYDVVTAADGPEAIELAKKERPHLILLDIMLPSMEGTDVLKYLKTDTITRNIPVMMLTAKGEEVDRIVGFELGADDYITKPFSPREVMLRIKAVLNRRMPDSAELEENRKEVVAHGGVKVDKLRHKVFIGKKELDLTTLEFRLLAELMASPGRVFPRELLIDNVWGHDTYVTDRVIDTNVRRLRQKLKDKGDLIETVRGVGYRFKE